MRWWVIYSVLFIFSAMGVRGQISHGGKPLPFVSLKSTNESWFEVMPSFDVREELRLDSLDDSSLRGSYRFAYKFITDYNRTNSGVSFTMSDGTRVWRLGIRSRGAYSINVLFTEYELPEGARLFLYNGDQSRILGAFNHLNNSDLNILPVAPVEGDELIIEYQEPLYVDFPGRLTVGEVNHAYRSLDGIEPQPNDSQFSCMPPVSCYREDTEITDKSVVLMIINGVTVCTGTLVNNTQSNGKPYLLTASHCLNENFTVNNPDYEQVAGSIVFFFNYDSPLCNTVMRGTEELSMASAYYRAVNEYYDMALLELLEIPPLYYQPYYAGWNALDAGSAPYSGLHHPAGSVKRISIFEDSLTLATFDPGIGSFAPDAHWLVKRWTIGSTARGSSGSPLFNNGKYVIGALSGGGSTCSKPENDYYYALGKAWTPEEDIHRQLKYWLDPASTGLLICEGLDPYNSDPCFRMSNVSLEGNEENIEKATVSGSNVIPLFGNNSLGFGEYAEAYNSIYTSRLHGVYVVTPPTGSDYSNLQVQINVYSGEKKPEVLLHTETFQPSYLNKVKDQNSFQETVKSLNRAQESFVRFTEPVTVKGPFYVGYKIVSAPADTYFSVYNVSPGKTSRNTTWIKYNTGWIEASTSPVQPFSTSLFIDPVIQYTSPVSSAIIPPTDPVHVVTDVLHHTVHVFLPEGVENADFTLYSMDGKIVQRSSIYNNYTVIPVASKIQGMHLVQIAWRNNQSVRKIIF